MMRKLSFLLLLCLFFRGFGQGSNISYANNAIKIGDKMPDMVISPVINYPLKSLRISDFKGKLLILDFWATYCQPCLHLLPKYMALQKQLADKMQIVLVTTESSQSARNALNRLNIHLPSVTADKFLYKIFQHRSIPHEVWIWDNKVIATTFGEEVNKESVLKIVTGQPVAMEQKQDNLGFNELKPLLVNGNGAKGQVFYQSIITPYIPGLNSLVGFQKSSDRIISVALNSSVLALYQQAFSHIDPLLELNNRYILDVPDSVRNKIDRGKQSTFHEWIKKYGFCYDLVLPPDFNGDVAEIMKTDLNRFFNSWYKISAEIEKREIDCLVLSRVSGFPSLESSGGASVFSVSEKSFVQKNLPVQNIVMELARRYRKLPTPFIDETGYRQPIDLVINSDMSDLNLLKKELLKSGLDLSVKKRVINMVIIQPVSGQAPLNYY